MHGGWRRAGSTPGRGSAEGTQSKPCRRSLAFPLRISASPRLCVKSSGISRPCKEGDDLWQNASKRSGLRPRLKRAGRIDETLLAHYVAERSNLSKADVTHALLELSAAIEDFVLLGHSVRLSGLGLITPSMNTQGELTLRILPDPHLLRAINDRRRFTGKIINAANLGKSGDELAAQWDSLHPDDPVET
ncbi:MAG: hypothetical protein IPM07_26815 [Anaerolineales bacterium]|nr:hypothetical protein [Anaerolineales bacterium]